MTTACTARNTSGNQGPSDRPSRAFRIALGSGTRSATATTRLRRRHTSRTTDSWRATTSTAPGPAQPSAITAGGGSDRSFRVRAWTTALSRWRIKTDGLLSGDNRSGSLTRVAILKYPRTLRMASEQERNQDGLIDVQNPSLRPRTGSRALAQAVAGVLSKATRSDPAELGDRNPSGGWIRRPMTASPIAAVHRARRAAGAAAARRNGRSCAAATHCATSSPAGRSPRRFRCRARSAATDANAALLGALSDGVSALLLRVGESDGVPPAARTALLEGVYLEHGAGDSRRRSGLRPRPPTQCWRWWTRSKTTSAPRCRSTSAPTR